MCNPWCITCSRFLHDVSYSLRVFSGKFVFQSKKLLFSTLTVPMSIKLSSWHKRDVTWQVTWQLCPYFDHIKDHVDTHAILIDSCQSTVDTLWVHVYAFIQIGGRNKDKVTFLGGNFDHPCSQSAGRDILSPSPLVSVLAKDKLIKSGFGTKMRCFRLLTGFQGSLLY